MSKAVPLSSLAAQPKQPLLKPSQCEPYPCKKVEYRFCPENFVAQTKQPNFTFLSLFLHQKVVLVILETIKLKCIVTLQKQYVRSPVSIKFKLTVKNLSKYVRPISKTRQTRIMDIATTHST